MSSVKCLVSLILSHWLGCTVYRAFHTEEQDKAAEVVATHEDPCPEDAQPGHHVGELLRVRRAGSIHKEKPTAHMPRAVNPPASSPTSDKKGCLLSLL